MRVHFRVNGWCDLCGGLGILAIEHVDVTQAGSPEVRATLIGVAEQVIASARARLAELDAAGSHGCEAAGERRFEEGRLQVVEHDLWNAVGLEPVAADGWCAPDGPDYQATVEDTTFAVPAIAEVWAEVFGPPTEDEAEAAGLVDVPLPGL